MDIPSTVVVRGDGSLFGETFDPQVLRRDDLRLDDQGGQPPDHLLWTTRGVKAYRQGKRAKSERRVYAGGEGL